MTRELAPKLRKQARYQQGIVGRGQVIGAGLSRAGVRRRIQSGDWQQLGRGVYATFTGKPTREAALWTAILRAGPGAFLSHETAAELHGFAGQPGKEIHITVPAHRRPGQHGHIPGVIIHRSRTVMPEPQAHWRLPRTGVEETILDLINAARTFDEAYAWICRAVGRRVTVPALIREALARRSRIRWRRWITQALDDVAQGINSPLERYYVHGVERAHGLPAAERQSRRRGGSGSMYVDNLYGKHALCVELDGVATHPDEGRWKDTARDNANVATDDTRTLRYGWVDATEKRCQTAQQVADALRRRGWTGKPRPCGPACPVR